MVERVSADQWGAEYGKIRSRYTELARRLKNLIADLTASAGIDIVQFEARAKSIESVVEKIQRKRHDDIDPLRSITDLTGIRVITYYLEDVEAVGKLIRREFEVDEDNSIDKLTGLATDQFGYRSTHYVATLSPTRSSLPEWNLFEGLKFEVQVRTALQHAWAAISHKVEYKSAEAAPEQVRRRLHRLSALFELADEQFSTLRDESRAQDVAYQEDVARGNLDVPLDASSYAAYTKITGMDEKIRSLVHQAGFRTETLDPVPSDRLVLDRKDLISVLRKNKINSLDKLDEYLSDTARIVRTAKAVLSAAAAAQEEDFYKSSLDDVLTLILIADPDRRFIEGVYDKDWTAILRSARDRLMGSTVI